METFSCLRRWLWSMQEGNLEQASHRGGQGLDLELRLALLEEQQLPGLDPEVPLLPLLDLRARLEPWWDLVVPDLVWASRLSLGQLEEPQGLLPQREPWVALDYHSRTT